MASNYKTRLGGVEIDPEFETKMVMVDARNANLWYVFFAPSPQTLKERFVTWVVGKYTPHWTLIRGAKTVTIPFTADEAGMLMARDEEERKERMKTPKPNVMVLQIGDPGCAEATLQIPEE